MHHTISYGKARVPFYRVYAQPLAGVAPIPESPFTGRPNTLFAAEVDIEVFGDNFLPAYTEGDNSLVVATDSMKNFVLNQALAYEGATLEGFLAHLGRLLLATYPQMQSLRVTGRELPFGAVHVPSSGAAETTAAFTASPVLYQRRHDDAAFATLDFARDGAEGGEGVRVSGHRCGRVGLELLKVTGSAFTHFVRDSYTTLPERGDRPLFITMDVFWRYTTTDDLLAPDHARYVPAEQVRDLVSTVFHEFVSESIQHLVHEMGQRALARFPQLAEISFAAQNHTPDPVAVSANDPKLKVYSTPFPAYGLITLTLARDA
ncbi:MAG TPA: urate oxidase [Ktedonobacterales bacterium]